MLYVISGHLVTCIFIYVYKNQVANSNDCTPRSYINTVTLYVILHRHHVHITIFVRFKEIEQYLMLYNGWSEDEPLLHSVPDTAQVIDLYTCMKNKVAMLACGFLQEIVA